MFSCRVDLLPKHIGITTEGQSRFRSNLGYVLAFLAANLCENLRLKPSNDQGRRGNPGLA